MKKLLSVLLAATPLVAFAAPASASAAAALQPFFLLIVFFVIFYLMVWRPQSKRAKEHKNLLAGLSKGDEVVTSGGLTGRVTKVTDDFVAMEIADKVEIKVQKQYVTATLVKGTLKSI